MTHLDARPLLFVVSGPSGAGKGTALHFLVIGRASCRERVLLGV